MTALIDVIFLLLLFFMLSSTFARLSEIPLSVGASGASALGTENQGFLRVSDTRLDLNGRPVAVEDVATRAASFEVDQLLVSVRSNVTAQRLADVLVVLQSAENLDVVLLGGS